MQLRQLQQDKTKDFSLLTHACGFPIHPEDFTAIRFYAKIKQGWQKAPSFTQKTTDTLSITTLRRKDTHL